MNIYISSFILLIKTSILPNKEFFYKLCHSFSFTLILCFSWSTSCIICLCFFYFIYNFCLASFLLYTYNNVHFVWIHDIQLFVLSSFVSSFLMELFLSYGYLPINVHILLVLGFIIYLTSVSLLPSIIFPSVFLLMST